MSHEVLQRLSEAAARFTSVVPTVDGGAISAYMRVGELLYGLTAAIGDAEANGISKEEIRRCVASAREIIGWSPFGKRMQTWPRGYPGDFETVEWIVRQTDRAEPNTVGSQIERHGLNAAVCQQHRNKIAFQARLMLSVAEQSEGGASILLIASGSALDLQSIKDCRAIQRSSFVLNDIDGDALNAARNNLGALANRCEFVVGNALEVTSRIAAQGPFDLILTGGLFDYLSERTARLLLRIAVTKWLKPGGQVYFSNMAVGNPFRHWMEYLEDWPLIERTENDVGDLLEPLRDLISNYEIARDATSLALLVVATKTS